MASFTWEKIETIFLAAADLAPGERPAFLDRACSGDEALRREIQTLLDSDRKNGETIARVVEHEAESLFGLTSMVGSRLGAYRVLREIGRGGMGSVYLATRADDQFQKNVAIKVVKRGMDTAEVLRRFQHERQILAGLDHIYIARLIDAGTAPDGRPFFVMEYVEGEPIDAYCLHHALSVEERCRLFLKVCEAVSHAHRNLVVHRDLKPGNIIVTADGTPKLLDFGVAKLLAPETGSRPTVTAVQSRMLTPQYASPEQVKGLPVNTSTDVYSLGAVLYELLTGSSAHRLDSTAPTEIERVVCLTEVPPPSAATQGVAGEALRGDLDNIVLMAMRKDPERRYQSVEQFAGDIRRYLDGRPVLARKDSLTYRAGKFVRRNWLVIAAAATVAASLVGGIVIAELQARRAERRLEQMVELANRSLFDVHSAIERLPGAMDARREIVKTTLAYLEGLSADAGRDDNLRLSLATAYWRLGDLQGYAHKPNLGDMNGALASYRKSADLLAPLLRRRPRDPNVVMQAVDTYTHMGSVLQESGDVPGTVHAYETALPFARLIAELQPDDVESNEAQGVILNDVAIAIQFTDPKRANDYARQHLALLPALLAKFPGNDDVADEAAAAHAAMSALLNRVGDAAAGLDEARKSAAIREGVAARHPNDVFRQRLLMIAYGHVGDHLDSPFASNLGNPKEAREYFQKCVSIARRIVETDPQDRTARYDLANALLRLGAVEGPGRDFRQSLARLKEASAIMESLVAEDPRATRYQRPYGLALTNLGVCQREMGRLDEALDTQQRGAAVGESMMAAHPGDINALLRITKSQMEISGILITRHDLAGALAHAQTAFAVAQKFASGPEPGLRFRNLGNASNALAAADRALGNWRDARDHAQLALDNWNRPEVKGVEPENRHQAAAILAESAAHLK